MAGTAVCVPIDDATQVGAARRAASALAEQAGLDEAAAGRAALIATELATNLARHARGGLLLLRLLDAAGQRGVELLAIDRGPGMANVERCLVDGYSTGGSPGTGLGAIRRAASQFDVHSRQPDGTVLAARVLAGVGPIGHVRPTVDRVDDGYAWGAVCVPAPHETACGDAFAVVATPSTWTFLVADGLGHGPLAADAAARAVEALHAAGGGAEPARVLQRAHEALRGGRGAAVGVGVVARATGAIRYAGIGNVSARVVTREGGRSLVSLNGTVGVQMPSPKEFDCVWPAGGLLVVHSDGINTRWDLGRDLALAARDPAVVAAALYRDHARGNDDVTVLVGRRREGA